jgi:hypothetical protein
MDVVMFVRICQAFFLRALVDSSNDVTNPDTDNPRQTRNSIGIKIEFSGLIMFKMITAAVPEIRLPNNIIVRIYLSLIFRNIAYLGENLPLE